MEKAKQKAAERMNLSIEIPVPDLTLAEAPHFVPEMGRKIKYKIMTGITAALSASKITQMISILAVTGLCQRTIKYYKWIIYTYAAQSVPALVPGYILTQN